MARKDLDRVIGIRLTLDDIKRLDMLAKGSFRGRADVVRLLLSQADLKATPDILLAPLPRPRVKPEKIGASS